MGPKRTMLRIDRGGDHRLHAILARFFSAPVRSVVENATLVGIRKEHGFPQVFGKASQKTLGFPTFSTTPTARTITHQFEAVGIQLRLADFLSKEWGDPPLPDHVNCLISLDRSPCRVKFTKALLGLHASFDRSMILLQDVVQVLDRPVTATASQDSFLLHS